MLPLPESLEKPSIPKRGRPRLRNDEKARRGTLRTDRMEVPASVEVEEQSAPGTETFTEIARQYAIEVLAGSIPACTWVKLACQRQQADLAREAVTDWPYVWRPDLADEACRFVECCPHVEGKWDTATITLEPSQIFLLCCLFGWRHRDDEGVRRFTVLYYELGRKGAKSTLMAAIAFYHLLKEQEPGASVVCGATTGTQARIVFGIMQRMARASRWLRGQGVTVYANAITTADGTAKPINAKASTQDGLNPSCIVLDESHAQKFGLHDVLKSAQGGRENPLLLAPTTAGYDLLSVGYALRTTLQKVLQGVFAADHLLGVIYTLDEGDDWRDERVWVKANPMIGVTPKRDWVRRYCQDAQQTPGLEGEFRVKVCSQWMQAASAWLSMTQWDACADPTLRIEAFAGQPCYIGCDLAQLDDLAAKAVIFDRAGMLYAFVQFYLPEAVVHERARTVPAYLHWVHSGILKLTMGPMIDYGELEADIRADCKRFAVKGIVFDQFGSSVINANLERDGFPSMVAPKNANMFTLPCRELETRLKHRKFRHDGNACLKWNASNVVVTRRTDDSLLPKKESPESPNKIDGIDALLEAMIPLLRQGAPAPAPFLLVLGR